MVGLKTVLALLAGVCVLAAVFLANKYPQLMALVGDGSGHVIIVGGGLAGLAATIEAVEAGAVVTILEKEPRIGGNSAKATSGINGVGTRTQEFNEVSDSIEAFVKDILVSGGGFSDEKKVRTLAVNSASAIEFLMSRQLNLSEIVQLGGHSAARTHRFSPTSQGKPVPVGFTIVNALKSIVENDLRRYVTIKTNSVFKGLKKGEDGLVIGVNYVEGEAEVEKSLEGAVVLSGGGYANDHTMSSLLKRYTPDLKNYPTTNGPWATGDVIKAIEPLVSLIDMDKVQVHPTGFVDPKDPTYHTKFLAPEALRGCGALLLDKNGRRFANELGRRDYVTDAIWKSGWHYGEGPNNPIVAAMLFNSEVIEKFGAPSASFYKFKGLIDDIGDIDEVATKLNITRDTLRSTIVKYAQDAEETEDDFGKVVFPTRFSDKDHYLLAYVTPSLHYCMGGIEINENAEVLQADGGVLRGVFAAGEVTGGVHGKNRLGGNSLLECVVFGRIAGAQAAHFNKQREH